MDHKLIEDTSTSIQELASMWKMFSANSGWKPHFPEEKELSMADSNDIKFPCILVSTGSQMDIIKVNLFNVLILKAIPAYQMGNKLHFVFI